MHELRRDGRVAEGGGLENRFTSDRDGGSNPSPSALILFKIRLIKDIRF
jgi:hypothetical protein